MAPRLNSSSSAAGSGAPQAAESFLNGGNSIYVEEMFRVWSEDPSKVHSSWDAFFRTGSYQPPPGVQRAAPLFGTSDSSDEQVRGHIASSTLLG